MKKLVLITMLFVLFLGTRCQALESAKDAFFGKHECHAIVGSHAQKCRTNWGDTLSGFARAQYGHGSLYKTIAAANHIADPKRMQAFTWIIIPNQPAPVKKTVAIPASKMTAISAPATIPMEDLSSTLPLPEVSMLTLALVARPVPTSTQVVAVDPKAVIVGAPAPTATKAEKTKPVKIIGYQFAVSGSDLHGKLQTQLVLFNSEEEKRLGLPIERIDLKPSLALAANDGNTTVFVHLKNTPTQPFVLLVGGIDTPVDSTQIRPHSGKIPGTRGSTRIASIFKAGAPAGISFLAGGPVAAGIVIGVPRLIRLGITFHERSQERKVAAAQAAVDKSNLALYRANIENRLLTKEAGQ